MIIESLVKTLEDSEKGFSDRQDVAPDVIEKSSDMNRKVIVPEKFKEDIESLEKYIDSSLSSGVCITVSLYELLSVCPRERKRADAYCTLIRFLKEEMGVNLNIKNNKK